MTGLDVRIWMMSNSIKAKDIAKEYGCTKSFVSKFLKGNKTSKDLADYLIKAGCPSKYFKGGKLAA